MSETPSNAVLLAKLEAMANIVNLNQTSSHDAHTQIILQTTKTNGRVTNLEKFKNIIIGALIFMNIVIIPVFTALIIKFIQK